MSMALTIEELFEQAMRLSPEARARLAALLLESLDDDPLDSIGGLWLAGAQRRLDDVRSGQVRMIPGDEALQRVRDTLRP